jgi:hypothetical protein
MASAVHKLEKRADDRRVADFPALATLRLHDADLVCLGRQGFVRAERRGNRTVFKLRFRRGNGAQAVRYISSAQEAESVRNELQVLQAPRELELKLAALSRSARKMIRDAKSNLQPVLYSHGYVFHGQAVRRPRRSASS